MEERTAATPACRSASASSSTTTARPGARRQRDAQADPGRSRPPGHLLHHHAGLAGGEQGDRGRARAQPVAGRGGLGHRAGRRPPLYLQDAVDRPPDDRPHRRLHGQAGLEAGGLHGPGGLHGEGGWVEFKQIATRRAWRSSPPSARGDTNFTPQALRVSQKKPDAVYFHAIPPSSALATETLRRVGYKGPVLHGAGSATPAFMAVGKKAVEGALVGTSALPCIASCPTTIRSSPASPRSCRPMTASTAPGRHVAAQAYDTVQIPLLAYRQVAAGKAADLTQVGWSCATPSRRRASIAASTACSATARPTTWAWTGAAPSW